MDIPIFHDEQEETPADAPPTATALSGKEMSAMSLLALLALTCIILILSPVTSADILPFVMGFPFAQIARGLRALSLPGGVGNIIAIILYVAVCLLPAAAFVFIRNRTNVKRNTRPEDALLLLISVVLFFVMYFMINPGLAMIAGPAPFERAVLGGIVHSLILAYFVIKLLRLFGGASAPGLGRCMGVMLHVMNALFVIMVFGVIFSRMLYAFEALRAGNTGHSQLGATYVFIALQHIVHALPYILNIWVVFAALRLLEALADGQHSPEALAAAKRVSRVCTVALGVTVLAGAGFNLLQLMFIRRLLVINSNISFPVASVLFVLGALLLTRFIAASKQLKDENDQFV